MSKYRYTLHGLRGPWIKTYILCLNHGLRKVHFVNIMIFIIMKYNYTPCNWFQRVIKLRRKTMIGVFRGIRHWIKHLVSINNCNIKCIPTLTDSQSCNFPVMRVVLYPIMYNKMQFHTRSFIKNKTCNVRFRNYTKTTVENVWFLFNNN